MEMMSSVFWLRCKTTEVKKHLIRYLDMFASIGGFRCVGHCGIDKYADARYHARDLTARYGQTTLSNHRAENAA